MQLNKYKMMKKEIIAVPAKIRYISEWKNFQIDNYPHILDKQIPGCGFTEYCLTNNENIILCSPRKILLQNKKDQHESEVYLVVNTYGDDLINPDKDLMKKPSKISVSKTEEDSNDEKKLTYFQKLKDEIKDYVLSRRLGNKPGKILVTYDSFGLVKDVLIKLGFFNNFRVIVDEFQSIFVDSRFKADTELGFVNELKDVQKVCYISATPMIDKYMEMIPEFANLPYKELDWASLQPNRIRKPKLTIRTSRSVYESAKGIIDKYKSGIFEKKYIKDNFGNVNVVESREAVIYVNSVSNIITIIGKAGLKPEECNILCSNTPFNNQKIKSKLGTGFTIGRVPLKGEQHKMFTFCTRTVYLGADFYSTNARTFVISDANVETLAVDISLDLPQILGRQRLEENPWKNEATFYYKSLVKKKELSQEEFLDKIRQKDKNTENLLGVYRKANPSEVESLVESYADLANLLNYEKNYLSVNTEKVPKLDKLGRQELDKDGKPVFVLVRIPVFNNLVRIAELRAFEIQQVDYADRFNVFNIIDETLGLEKDNAEIMDYLSQYRELPRLFDKLKFLCELDFKGKLSKGLLEQITEKNFQDYFELLGSERIKALGYNISNINKELGIVSFNKSLLFLKIIETFSVGERYTSSWIKSSLKSIYEESGYEKTPVASDLENWFDIKKVQINTRLDNGTYKRDKGYEILSKKGGQL